MPTAGALGIRAPRATVNADRLRRCGIRLPRRNAQAGAGLDAEAGPGVVLPAADGAAATVAALRDHRPVFFRVGHPPVRGPARPASLTIEPSTNRRLMAISNVRHHDSYQTR